MSRRAWGGRLALLAALTGLGLAACGDHDDQGQNGASTSQPTVGFEMFAQQQVEQSTCDTLQPASTNVTFIFSSDQDTAEPRDLSKVVPGCTQ